MSKKYILIFGLLSLNLTCLSRELKDFERFLKILGQLESNNNDFAVGDNGKSISRYQIQLKCYQDATNYDKTITFSYKSLTNQVNSARIVKSYILRYSKSNDYEEWARLWNSGPNWKKKLNKTNNYWRKFQAINARRSKSS